MSHGGTIVFRSGGAEHTVDPSRYWDLSFPTRFDGSGPEAFGLPSPVCGVVRTPAFVGSVAEGGSVNCRTVRDLNPHTLTHIEGIGHIQNPEIPISDVLHRFLYPAVVVTANPSRSENGDLRVEPGALAALESLPRVFREACIVRVLGDSGILAPAGPPAFTGTNPPYFLAETTGMLRDQGTLVLLTDLPSLDREDDARLPAHRAFLMDEAGRPLPGRAIVELLHIPPEIPDGTYLLQLAPLRWHLDSSPVRPLLYPLES